GESARRLRRRTGAGASSRHVPTDGRGDRCARQRAGGRAEGGEDFTGAFRGAEAGAGLRDLTSRRPCGAGEGLLLLPLLHGGKGGMRGSLHESNAWREPLTPTL